VKVVVQATGLTRKNTGVGQYIGHLLPHLVPRLAAAGCEVSLLLAEDAHLPALNGEASITRLPIARTRRAGRVFWEHLYVPVVSWPADVYVSLMSAFPFTPIWGRRKLVVIQDLFHLLYQQDPVRYPCQCGRGRLFYLNQAMRRTVNAADGIIVISQFVANCLREHFKISAARIMPIPCGVDQRRFIVPSNPLQSAEIRQRYRLPERFYLFVGSLASHKNLRSIVDAYVSGGNPDVLLPVAITAAHPAAEVADPTVQWLQKNRLQDSFRFLGFVPDEDLPALYGAARALIYPSLHEGFGIPPLEAMACGTPVVTSNRTAIPEVVGDAALVIDPSQPTALLEALCKVNDESIRGKLIAKGLKRAQGFTWESTAQQMAEVITGKPEAA
jgi:glycosyltransferase involved in cell wall biosynthesis